MTLHAQPCADAHDSACKPSPPLAVGPSRTAASWLACLAMTVGLCSAGCVNLRAPESIQVNTGPPREQLDSSQTPHPPTLEQSHAELDRAYRRIRYLEDRLDHAQRDRDEYKSKYKKLKDRYED